MRRDESKLHTSSRSYRFRCWPLETIELIVWLAWNVKFKIGCSTTTTVDLFTQLEACDLIKEATLEKDKTEKSRKEKKVIDIQTVNLG